MVLLGLLGLLGLNLAVGLILKYLHPFSLIMNTTVSITAMLMGSTSPLVSPFSAYKVPFCGPKQSARHLFWINLVFFRNVCVRIIFWRLIRKQYYLWMMTSTSNNTKLFSPSGQFCWTICHFHWNKLSWHTQYWVFFIYIHYKIIPSFRSECGESRGQKLLAFQPDVTPTKQTKYCTIRTTLAN